MEDDDFISKTRRKKHMLDVQALGVSLTKLSPEQIARFGLPERLCKPEVPLIEADWLANAGSTVGGRGLKSETDGPCAMQTRVAAGNRRFSNW